MKVEGKGWKKKLRERSDEICTYLEVQEQEPLLKATHSLDSGQLQPNKRVSEVLCIPTSINISVAYLESLDSRGIILFSLVK